ncbi:hypothetical protein OF83DRAFT_711886 [Amylostereum chailletii]|nr:hypothetical protein OF83DRAFT_711886 [Amylostereum chailletii]
MAHCNHASTTSDDLEPHTIDSDSDAVKFEVTVSNFEESAALLSSIYKLQQALHPDFPALNTAIAKFLHTRPPLMALPDIDGIVFTLVDVYYDMIFRHSDFYFTGHDATTVLIDAVAALAILASLAQTVKTKCKVLDIVIAATPGICEGLWSQRAFMSGRCSYIVELLQLILYYLDALTTSCIECDCIPKYGDLGIVHIAFMCWYCHPPTNQGMEVYTIFRHVILHSDGPSPPPNSFMASLVIECKDKFGVENILSRFYRDLERDDVVDMGLQDCLIVLGCLVAPELVTDIGAGAEFSGQITRALCRQRRTGKCEAEEGWAIWTRVVSMLRTISRDSKRSGWDLTPVMERYTIAILPHGASLSTLNPSENAQACTAIVNDYRTVASACSDPRTTHHRRARKHNYALLRRDTKLEWFSTMRELREAFRRCRADESDRRALAGLLVEWNKLGAALELDEAHERTHGFCAAKACEFYAARSPYRMQLCVGCKKVCYCDRTCQRSDWNAGHREACARRHTEKTKDN